MATVAGGQALQEAFETQAGTRVRSSKLRIPPRTLSSGPSLLGPPGSAAVVQRELQPHSLQHKAVTFTCLLR